MTTCLLVDDSRVTRKLAERIMSNLNISTTQAENGLEAFAACTTSMPDLVLLDWNMPVMNGIEFLKKLRVSGLHPQPKVMICTTETDISRIAEAMEQGADEYIMKPFDQDIVASKLRLLGLL